MSEDVKLMTVPQLKKKAEDLGIEGFKTMKKDDLIEAIEEHSAAEGKVEDTSEVEKEVVKPTPKVEKKKLDNDDEVVIMNNTTGRYGYRGRSGFAMEMTEYGDTLDIPFGELKRMRAEQKRHLEDAFIIVLDEDAVKELRYEKLYENIFDRDSVEELLRNPEQLIEVLPKMPSAMKETVGSIAIKRIKNGEIFDMRVKKAVEDTLNVKIDA